MGPGVMGPYPATLVGPDRSGPAFSRIPMGALSWTLMGHPILDQTGPHYSRTLTDPLFLFWDPGGDPNWPPFSVNLICPTILEP